MDGFPDDSLKPTMLRRKISDHINYCSLDKCGKHNDDRQEDDYNKALENFKYYKTIKSKINFRYEKIQKLRYLIIPALLFLLVIRTFSSTNPNIQNSVSFEKVKSFWRGIFLGGKEVITIDTLDMLMSQIYNSFYKAYHINDFLYVGVNYEPIDLVLYYANLDTSESKQVHLQKRFDFERVNITAVLNLPFDLNDEKNFKKFTTTYDTITLIVKNVVYCVDLLGTRDCLQSNIRIDYVNRGFQYLGFIIVTLKNYIEVPNSLPIVVRECTSEASISNSKTRASTFKKPETGTGRKTFVNAFESKLLSTEFRRKNLHDEFDLLCNNRHCNVTNFDYLSHIRTQSISQTHEQISENFESLVNKDSANDGTLSSEVYDFFKQNKLIITLILIMSILSLIIDLAVYYVVILDHKLEKSFELKLILLNQETTFQDNLFSLPKKKLNVWTLLSTFKNIATIFFCFTMIFPSMPISSKSYLPHSIQMLAWLSMVEVINNQKDFGLIMSVFKAAFQHYTKSFIGYITLAIAFIVSATLIFQTSEKYLTFSDSFYTIFSLMVGDSVLEFFDDLKSYGMFGTLFMICCILFFVFMIQSLYITIITDSFFTLIDEDESKPETELNNPKMAESQIKEPMLTNRSELVNNIPEESKEYESILKNESGIKNESMFCKESLSKNESSSKNFKQNESPKRDNLSISQEEKEENFSYVINTEEGSPSPHEIPLKKIFIPPLRLEKNVHSLLIPLKDQHENSSFDINLGDFRRPSNLINKVKFDDQTITKFENVPGDIEENTDIELFNIQQKRLLEIDKTRLKNELEMVNKMKRLIQFNLSTKKSEDRLMFQLCLEFIVAKIKKQTKNIQKMKNHI